MTDGSGRNHMEYDCLNADRLGDDAWIGAVFFLFQEKNIPRPAVSKMSEANDHIC